MAVSQIGIAIPNFWFAILLILLFSVKLRWFSAGGFPGWSVEDGGGVGPALRALVLPAVALAVVQASILTRIVRSAVLDVLREDFVRTARAKGVSPRGVLWGHVLRNAMVPVLTVMGLQFANLLTGTVVIEQVFSLPGLGRLVFQAIANRDLLVVRNVVMLLAAAVVVINFVVDVLYVVIDPRLRARARMSDAAPLPIDGAAPARPPRAAPLAARQLRDRRGAGRGADRRWRCSRSSGRRWPATELDIPNKLQPPTPAHWLGTDSLGRDIVSLLIVGSRVSIAVGLIAVGIGIAFGVALGLLAAVQARLGRGGGDAPRRLHLRLPGAALGDHADRDLRARARDLDRRHRHLQRAGVRAHHAGQRAGGALARVRHRRARPAARASGGSPSSTCCRTSPRS